MNRFFVDAVERLLIAFVARRGGVQTVDPPLAPSPEEDVPFVLGAPVAEIPLPPPSARRTVELAWRCTSPVEPGADETASGFLVRPRGEVRRTLLLVPGWLARFRPFFRAIALLLARRGTAVAVLDLPGHFGRTAPGASHGARFFSGDPERTRRHLRGAVGDARALVRLLGRVAPGRPVVAAGFSLGAWVAGTTASLEPGTAAILVTPAAEPAQLLLASPLLADVRRQLAARGHDPERVAARVEPLALARRSRPTGNVVLVRAERDQVIPADQVERLGIAWGATTETAAAGHMTVYVEPGFLRRFGRLVDETAAAG